MKLQKTPLALAASALLASVPFAAHAASASFSNPTSNQTVSGVLQGSACEVRGTGISWVRFYWDYDLVSTDKAAPFQSPSTPPKSRTAPIASAPCSSTAPATTTPRRCT